MDISNIGRKNILKALKIYKKISAALLAVILSISLAGCSFTGVISNEETPSASISSENPSQSYAEKDLQSFNDFTNEIFKDELSDNTLNLHCVAKDPAKFGIEKYPATFGKIEFDKLDDTAKITDLLNRLSTFKYNELSKSQQATYDILKNMLQTELEYSDLYMYGTELTPYSGVTVYLPILLTEYEFYSKSDVEDYIGLLNDMKRYFTELIELEKLRSKAGLFMSDDIASELVKQCSTFIDENSGDDSFLIRTFESRLNGLTDISQSEKAAFISANKTAVADSVIPAYRIIIDGITGLMGTGKYSGGLSSYPDGRKYYEYIIKSDLGWSKSMDELDEMLDQYITASYLSIQSILLSDQTITAGLDNFSFTLTEPDKMITDLKKKTENDFPAAPNVNYEIKDIDKSLEAFANPAMYIIAQIDNYTNNVILVNKYNCNYSELYPTIAHEGYPGHLYQHTYFLSLNPEPIRRLLEPGGYIEGWATYAELCAYDYDDAASDNKLFQLLRENQKVTLGLYAKMDMGVNYYGWTKERLKIFLKDWGISDSLDIDFLYNYLIAEPGSYPKYSVGGFAFMDWKNQASSALGDKFDLKEFHKFIMDLGPVPFDIIDKKLPEWITTQKNK